MASLRRNNALLPDSLTARFLYSIIKQLDLKSVDWSIVAEALHIANGHAARMRYSRFKNQVEGNSADGGRKASSRAAAKRKDPEDKKGFRDRKKRKKVTPEADDDRDWRCSAIFPALCTQTPGPPAMGPNFFNHEVKREVRSSSKVEGHEAAIKREDSPTNGCLQETVNPPCHIKSELDHADLEQTIKSERIRSSLPAIKQEIQDEAYDSDIDAEGEPDDASDTMRWEDVNPDIWQVLPAANHAMSAHNSSNNTNYSDSRPFFPPAGSSQNSSTLYPRVNAVATAENADLVVTTDTRQNSDNISRHGISRNDSGSGSGGHDRGFCECDCIKCIPRLISPTLANFAGVGSSSRSYNTTSSSTSNSQCATANANASIVTRMPGNCAYAHDHSYTHPGPNSDISTKTKRLTLNDLDRSRRG